MSDFPRSGDIASTRAWLDKEGFTGVFEGWKADAILGLDKTDIQSSVPGENGLKLWGFLNTARQTTGAQLTEEQVQAQALPQQIIDRIRSSVLCVSNSDGDVIATAIVWDYTDTDVLLLTNYHTWDSSDFRYCFPPVKKISKGQGKRKRDHEPMVVTFHNNEDFSHELTVYSSAFHSYEKDEDFAVLKIPKAGFTMPRIPISLAVSLNLKIHAFGYIGHSKQFNVSGGEISGLITEGFTMNLLSAGGYSGAAVLADGYGRAVGYMGGNYDASNNKNSQHQSYAFRFDRVIHATDRQITPTSYPAGKGDSKVKATP